MTTKYKHSQLAGIIIAYIIVCVAATCVYICLIGLPYLKDDLSRLWDSFLTELSYYIFLILFCLLCVIPWLKKNKLPTWWMLLSMLITAIVIYVLLALTCKWEPEFLRHEGMELYAPWWLAGNKDFFVGLTPETVPPFYKINLLANGVFQCTLLDYPGLFVWAACCVVGRFVRKK